MKQEKIAHLLKNELEAKVSLILYIGRDLSRRGKSGFNLDVELGEPSSQRYVAYNFLKENGIIDVFNEETISDIDGTATFVECKFTKKGEKLYERIEESYRRHIEPFTPELS